MQIVVDIPEKVYESLQDGILSEIQSMFICRSVKDGIVLPEGHGRLVDANKLFKKLFICSDGTIVRDTDIDNFPITINVRAIKKAIRDAPIILEADKTQI